MNLFDVIGLHEPAIAPKTSKFHLATTNGVQDPLDVFFAGDFEQWQRWQGQKNFERPYVVALIKLPGRDRWLFAGCYRQLGRDWVDDPAPGHWMYRTAEVAETRVLSGRVVVSFHRSGRASYLNAEKWAAELSVSEILPQRMSVGGFPGYHAFTLDKARLDLIVRQGVETWKGALEAVGGVYLITDTATGKLYVGSATGEGGLWSRWCSYAATGHGGNLDLKTALKEKGAGYADHWQWSILEIADTHASADDVVRREAHWKDVLCSRVHGYNGN